MNNENGRSYGSETKKDSNIRNKLIGTTAAAIAAGAGIVGLAHSSETTSREAAQIEIEAAQIGLDTDVAVELVKLQAVNEYGAAANEVPAASWRVLNTGSFAVEGTIIDSATAKYKEMNNLTDQDNVPDSVSSSITFTAHTWAQQRRAHGESAHPQPGQELGLTTVETEDGTDYAIVSNPVVTDVN